MTTSYPSVTVGIVNYNGADHLQDLLASLERQTLAHRTLIIDNASTDGSARAAYNRYPQHSYLPLRRNTGFAHAANLIARRSKSEIVVYVNPDTKLASDFLEHMVAPFASNDSLGAVAGTLVFATQPDVIASAGVQIHRNGVAIDRLLGEQLEASEPEAIFGASGGAAAYRRQALLEVGGFPEAFFMYLEDVDLAYRLQLAGWAAVWQPAAVAHHAYSASAIEGSAFKRKLIARNRLWVLARCLPSSMLAGTAMPTATYDLLALGFGALYDRPATLGRIEALARLLPRWCERRAIAPDDGQVDRIAAWMLPSISPLELRRLRRLTAGLAASG